MFNDAMSMVFFIFLANTVYPAYRDAVSYFERICQNFPGTTNAFQLDSAFDCYYFVLRNAARLIARSAGSKKKKDEYGY
jgi:hypothetical protein